MLQESKLGDVLIIACLWCAPGSGKALLARAVSGIVPRMSVEESLEDTEPYSIAERLRPSQPLMRQRPFQHYIK